MEFKKIQLNGFKSFAEKTDFIIDNGLTGIVGPCLLYTSPSPRDVEESRMPSSA